MNKLQSATNVSRTLSDPRPLEIPSMNSPSPGSVNTTDDSVVNEDEENLEDEKNAEVAAMNLSRELISLSACLQFDPESFFSIKHLITTARTQF